MKQPYRPQHWLSACLLVVAFLLGAGPLARAQSGPYGNEWIVPGQQYYKIKTARDGLYRLDYAYLTQAGLTSAADPNKFQLWRRGQEVAIYVGGNSTSTFDASTFIEFYGQRNDGVLDVGMYKNAADHYQKLYSLYTDTASYFLTVAPSTGGRKRMAQLNPAPTDAAHTYWRNVRTTIYNTSYNDVDVQPYVFQPWGEPGEGFFSGNFRTTTLKLDSLQDDVVAGRAPQVELQLVGSSRANHRVTVYVVPPAGGTNRALGPAVDFTYYEQRKLTYTLLHSDISAAGVATIVVALDPAGSDQIRIAHTTVSYSQPSLWNTNRSALRFSNDSTLGTTAYYSLANVPATVRGFDVTDPYNVQRIDGRAESGNKRGYVFPGAQSGGVQHNLWLIDEAKALVPLPARPKQFSAIAPAAYNFLIVSHASLMKATGTFSNPVQAYADYRASSNGGSYQPLVVTSDQLYDQFHYGEKSALAIRNFGSYMLTSTRPKSLLLLGKGLVVGEFDGVYHRQFPEAYHAPGGPTVRDLVPTSLRGASDIFLTADWPHDNYAARMATGRVSAQTPAQVASYLRKLQEYEATLKLPDAPGLEWRKNALNIAGGEDAGEFQLFGGYLNAYKRRIEQPLFAGRVVKTYARTDVSLPQKLSIANELNAGLALISYFGHGDPTSLDFDLGTPEDPSNGYNNKGKYPVMFVNGCAAGNDFRARLAQFPEDWLLTPDKGLIGFMGESSFGFAQEMHAIQDKTYQLLLNDPQWYGKPVAEIQNEVARRLQSEPNGLLTTYLGTSVLMSTVWHADPALRLFAPPKPDFAFGAPALEIVPVGTEPVRTKSTQFKLLVKVRNPGKVTYDKVDISVKRKYDPTTLPARSDETFLFPNLRQALHDTTYALVLPNTGNTFGNNQFTVTLDYQNHVDELDETNNQATLNFVFLKDGITLLNPPEFAIVSTRTPRLVGQTNDPAGPKRTFLIEADTALTFNSPAYQHTSVQEPLVAEWKPTLPALVGRDSVVWYWRMKFETKLTPDENDEWVVSSFRVIANSPAGWSQSHHGQFRRDDRKRVDVAVPSGKWNFSDITQSLTLQTKGGGSGAAATFGPTYGLQIGGNLLSVLNCGVEQPNLIVSVFDGNSLKPLRTVPGGPYDSCGIAPNRYYHFAASATDNINSPARQQQLLTLLNNLPQGAYVAVVSVNKVNFASFPAALKAAFTALGSQKITQLQNGDPFVFVGQKGPGAQAALERTADLSSSVPREDQEVMLNGTIGTRGGSGVVTTTRIGPAQEWTTLFHTIRTEPSDSYTLRVVGIDTLGATKVWYPNVTSRSFSLAGIPASQYPYLQLELALRDTLNRTAPQVKQLLVTYKGMPEGVVRRDLVVSATPTAYDAATLQQQANSGYLKIPVTFQNVAPINFSTPVKARVSVSDGTHPVRISEVTLPPLLADGSVSFTTTPDEKGVAAPNGKGIDVRGLNGSISVQVDVNMNRNLRRLPELFYFNNALTLPTFQINNQNVPPVLDVAFDGQHILDGEIVSPTPTITVLMSDEDKLRPILRTNAFDVYLTKPGQAPVKIDINGSNVVFAADSAKGTARIEFQPGKGAPLADGIYKLEVQGRDASNTQATSGEKYSVRFEVINASTITHLFPYPNPITSKARFVFTLTGSEVPRNMKIQIMTLTGKVVREIMMHELGMLRIGNNITDYAWDGTDEFGDRLANGTYLYRVVMDDPQNQFQRRTTTGDQSFKKEWGKLVLLR